LQAVRYPTKKDSMNRINQELIEASRENNLPEVRRLLSVGADINAKDNDGSDWTPLIEACNQGHVHVVKVLREHGADIDAKDIDGWTALHGAIANGYVAVVVELLGPNDRDGATTILGKRKSRGGANTEAKIRDGSTPLHIASQNDHLAIVKALLAVGADCCAIDNTGDLPIDRAVSCRNSAVVKCLLQQLYATTRRLPLHELLKDLTWIVNPNISGAPPLRYALDRNVLGTDDVVEILEYLVGQNHELISSLDPDGWLPLHVACRRGASFPIVQSLVNLNKASIKSVTSEGDLPIFLACEMPEPSLDTIFILMKLYPELVY
jgi:ankyrin repeat protein